MKDEIFVANLRSLAPSREIMKQRLVRDDIVEMFLDRYNCKKRSHVRRAITITNSIFDLVSNYDCSGVQIGIVNFLPEVVERPDHYYFADAEQDIIVIDKITLGIYVVDPFEFSHVIWKCAASGDLFLEALLVCTSFFTLRITQDSLLYDKAFNLNAAEECSEKAGGDAFLSFYRMLFGC